MKHYKFNYQISFSKEKKYSLENILGKFLSLLIPKANPDFENNLSLISLWYIEFDDVHNFTNREIGFDKDNNILEVAPYKKNLGIWTDSNLTLQDFNKWNIEEISSEIFEDAWKKFIDNNSF